MGEKVVVGPITKGLSTGYTPFAIDNDSFPTLINAYQWRGRLKRKRGTSFLGRLNRFLSNTDGAGALSFTIVPNTITPGVSQFIVGTEIFTDSDTTATALVNLLSTGSGTGTLNRSTGVVTITGAALSTAVFYFPGLPVLGLEDFAISTSQFPGTLAFDTTYAYNIGTSSPYDIYSVSFYKNLSSSGTYVTKSTWTPVNWSNKTYMQFLGTNYQGAFWLVPGVDGSAPTTGVGMQFLAAADITSATQMSATTVDFSIPSTPLVEGDFVFANEFTGVSGSTLNFQTGYVTTVAAPIYTVTFPNAVIGAGGLTPGILQYLTNSSDTSKSCIRWYDGDPTGGATPFAPSTQLGWVNFCPPLSELDYSIADLPADQYYLVGAKVVIPFKDRLLFFGPIIQASSGSPIYLQDTLIYSQNGTIYYTVSFDGSTALLPTTTFFPQLVPTNQTATAQSWFEDSVGFGGFISAGLDMPIQTVDNNEDVLIVGLSKRFSRLVYTSNDVFPFLFYSINSELGASSTFSSITMDRGTITFGNFGIVMTSQTNADRIDLQIPDQVFQINYTENGDQQITARRDYINEWIYFTYRANEWKSAFPNQTLQYNYREQTWAIFNESFTTYGGFRKVTGNSWAALGGIYGTWSNWNDPWDSGPSTLLQPEVIGGNQQGFVMIRAEGTGEGTSLFIQDIVGSVVTSPNHSLNTMDFIQISDVQGDVSCDVNGKVFSILRIDENTFSLNPSLVASGYTGGGLITRLYVPQIQSRQFPVGWDIMRKTRLGPQMYLLTSTAASQITLVIFLSMDSDNAYNVSTIVPSKTSTNNSLIYSTVLYTCLESRNIGLTPANTNLQMQVAKAGNPRQIWHRINTSLIGDTVQVGFTLSDEQMRSYSVQSLDFVITGATKANPCVLTVDNTLSEGDLVQIAGVEGMTQLNGNIYFVTVATPTSLSIDVDSKLFGVYTQNGTATQVGPINPTAEIEIHSFILDVNPTQFLA